VAKSKESRAGPSLRLAPEWAPERDPNTGKVLPRGRLWDFTEQIAQSRREGLVLSSETYSIFEIVLMFHLAKTDVMVRRSLRAF
jgi:hypothetical protein